MEATETRPELVVVQEAPPPLPPEEQQLQPLMCKVNQTFIHSSACGFNNSLLLLLTYVSVRSCSFRAVR